jgi:hypothetical protein
MIYQSAIIKSIFTLLCFSLITVLQAQRIPSNPSPLFQDTSLLEISIRMDIKEVTEDVVDRHEHLGKLIYSDPILGKVVVDLKIKTRGKTRANPEVCRFPPLQLNFKKHENEKNLFSGQDKLKLVVHCQNSAAFDQYVLQEYLTYRHYNILTDNSFAVRLLKVKYIDNKDSTHIISRYGMLIEDLDALANRRGMIEVESVDNQDYCDVEALDKLTVFQFMIGNTDWSISERHNIKLIGDKFDAKHPIPIAYDFDYSGAIKTYYAIPPESLPIENVRSRIFRGTCRSAGHYEQIFSLYIEKKKEIYDLYGNFTRMDSRRIASTLKYFDQFYKIIESPKRSKREILHACTLHHTHRY